MNNKLRTHNLGFPRIGAKRELKRALESFWAGKTDEAQLLETAKTIRAQNWCLQGAAGIDLIPSNDFSLYDQMLDMCALVGAVPDRFHWSGERVDVATYFAMARGSAHGGTAESGCCAATATALEMTKWFDTNYHYLVPELREGQVFRLASTRPFDEFTEALSLGIRTVPVLIGPLTFLLLGKTRGADFDRLSLLPSLLPVYVEVLQRLQSLGAEWVQLDEPALCLDLNPAQQAAFATAYEQLRAAAPNLKLLLATYFGDLRENLATACQVPVDALHWDAVRASQEMDRLLEELPTGMQLSLGVVDGRNVWRNDFQTSLKLLRKAVAVIGHDHLIVSPSCSLLHAPLSLKHETKLDTEFKSWLAFAEEKLTEVGLLAALVHQTGDSAALMENRAATTSRRTSPRIHDHAVKRLTAAISEAELRRASPFPDRRARQQARLNLPLLPTTTIGSFPQTEDVRAARAHFKKGEISHVEYEAFLEQKIAECVRWQEEAGPGCARSRRVRAQRHGGILRRATGRFRLH